MAVAKCKTGDIINGLSTIYVGGVVSQYDPTQRDQHLTDASGANFAVVKDRYLRHGGVGGSGTWEH